MSTSLNFVYGHSRNATRYTTITTVEQKWLDALKRSGMDLSQPFEAKLAVAWIAGVPTKKGTRIQIPNKYKLNYVLRKSPDFEQVDKEKRRSQNKTNQWRLIQ